MTARVISEKMTAPERAAFLAGIVEGLAHARYIKDDKATEGRSCIYSWFYDDKSTLPKIHEAFERYPDTLPGRIIGALVATKCGA